PHLRAARLLLPPAPGRLFEPLRPSRASARRKRTPPQRYSTRGGNDLHQRRTLRPLQHPRPASLRPSTRLLFRHWSDHHHHHSLSSFHPLTLSPPHLPHQPPPPHLAPRHS